MQETLQSEDQLRTKVCNYSETQQAVRGITSRTSGSPRVRPTQLSWDLLVVHGWCMKREYCCEIHSWHFPKSKFDAPSRQHACFNLSTLAALFTWQYHCISEPESRTRIWITPNKRAIYCLLGVTPQAISRSARLPLFHPGPLCDRAKRAATALQRRGAARWQMGLLLPQREASVVERNAAKASR